MGRKYDYYIKQENELTYRYVCSSNTTKNIHKDRDFPLPNNKEYNWRYVKSNKRGHNYIAHSWNDLTTQLRVVFTKYVPNSHCKR